MDRFTVDLPPGKNQTIREERTTWAKTKDFSWDGYVKKDGILVTRYIFKSAADAVEFKLLFG